MIGLLKVLSAALRRVGAPRPSTPQKRHVTLQVESLDQRLVPSAVAAKAVVPAPAALPIQTESTGGVKVAELDRPVHGYKWRPRPWGGGAESPRETLTTFVAAQVSHLAAGGADGILVLTGGGRVMPHPPEGPL